MPVEKCEGYYPYPSNTSMVIYPRASRIFSTSGAACIARSRSRLLVEAAQRMRQHYERVVRYPADIRHRLPARYERLCADNRRGYAALLKSNSVVHTAR